MRGDILAQKNVRRGARGKYLGQPSSCSEEPGKKSCLKKLQGPDPGVCRNCQAPEVQTEKIKILIGK